jgi:hypothetical protein
MINKASGMYKAAKKVSPVLYALQKAYKICQLPIKRSAWCESVPAPPLVYRLSICNVATAITGNSLHVSRNRLKNKNNDENCLQGTGKQQNKYYDNNILKDIFQCFIIGATST